MVPCGQGPVWSTILGMSNQDVQFKLRLPALLKKRLEDAAERAGRSVSAELVHRLEQSFIPSRREPPGTLGIRAGIAAQREVYQASVEMLTRAVVRMEAQLRLGSDEPYPGQASGKTLKQSLADTKDALEVFNRKMEVAALLLSELAVGEASGAEIDVDEFRERAIRAGVL